MLVVLLVAAPVLRAEISPPQNSFNIKQYGATGNRADNATRAIQSAIDACTSVGGGVVYVPPGAYTTGMPLLAPELCSAIAMPADWKIASGIEPSRDHWVILRRPDSPSFCSAFRLGTTWTINCMTIEAEMYGITLSANRLKRSSAPPENMLNMSTMVPSWVSISCSIASGLTPGTGMKQPSR